MTAPANGLLSVQEVREALGSRAPQDVQPDESQLELAISAATPVLEQMAGGGVRFLQRTITETFDGGRASLPLGKRPTAITSVTVGGLPLTEPDGYTLIPEAGLVRCSTGRFPHGTRTVVVVYTTGWPLDEMPANIKLAAAELVRSWTQQGRQSPRTTRIGALPVGDVRDRIIDLLADVPGLPGFA